MNVADNYDQNHSKINNRKNNSTDFKVTPWEVEGDIDYGNDRKVWHRAYNT